MIHKFVIELIDDCKGFEQDVDYLERIYGAEPIKEHDEEIYNKALDDFVGRLIEELSHTTLLKDGYYLANIIKPLAEQLKAGGKYTE